MRTGRVVSETMDGWISRVSTRETDEEEDSLTAVRLSSLQLEPRDARQPQPSCSFLTPYLRTIVQDTVRRSVEKKPKTSC